MSPLLSWLFFVTFLGLGLWVALRLDRIFDRVWTDDLAAARHREEALKVMESWHPSKGPQPVHSVNEEADARHADPVCTCRRIEPSEYDQYNPFGYRIPNPSCLIHAEES